MRLLFILLISFCTLFTYINVSAQFASEPAVTRNVHVMRNVNPSQCRGSWNGNAASGSVSAMSGYGIDTGVAAVGTQSCTGCAFDSNSHDCVCNICYSYFN